MEVNILLLLLGVSFSVGNKKIFYFLSGLPFLFHAILHTALGCGLCASVYCVELFLLVSESLIVSNFRNLKLVQER